MLRFLVAFSIRVTESCSFCLNGFVLFLICVVFVFVFDLDVVFDFVSLSMMIYIEFIFESLVRFLIFFMIMMSFRFRC